MLWSPQGELGPCYRTHQRRPTKARLDKDTMRGLLTDGLAGRHKPFLIQQQLLLLVPCHPPPAALLTAVDLVGLL